ncbi:hypothetical protein CCP4SC76_2040008 [Gammaproteobacteria bacterium]
MNPPDQGKSADHGNQDFTVAFDFFKRYGEPASSKEKDTIFSQGQSGGLLSSLKTNKIYFLVEGKVDIKTVSGNVIRLEAGGIFGEFSPHSSLNATAVASTRCELISITEKQLLPGIKEVPEFIFVLMDKIVKNLRDGKHVATQKFSSRPVKDVDDEPIVDDKPIVNKEIVLNAKMLNEIKQRLGDGAVIVVPENQVLFREGAAAMLMYVILDGQVMTKMGGILADKAIRKSGPGDIIGEIALIDQSPRTATVVAETRCTLLSMNRQSLLELVRTLPDFGLSLLRVLASRLTLQRTAGDYAYVSDSAGFTLKEEEDDSAANVPLSMDIPYP